MSLLKVNEVEVFNTTILTLTASGGVSVSNDLTTGGAIIVSGLANQSSTRTNLGIGSIATQASDSVSITGGSVTGITDLAISDGGTGASTAVVARRNLLPSMSGHQGKGLVINSNEDDITYQIIGDVTADSTHTFTNKSGNISQWTIDSSFLVPAANGGTGQTSLAAVDAADFGSIIDATTTPITYATSGFNLTADGSGNVSWSAPSVADGGVTTAKLAANSVREDKISSYDMSITANATAGFILVADGLGNATWASNAGGGGGGGGGGTTDLDGGSAGSIYTSEQTFDGGSST
ncbi:MAG: hypothetical protein CMP39_04370 [Rickettsiales bacterium]|nr:hypothetical protein [Rickettsiales bacterium]|tara:strand:- start:531 stop:1412 length:882 start_codon:yes stop_codon:yes gene_type:complete